jgi:alkylated DNA repair dioxygenase AlkB
MSLVTTPAAKRIRGRNDPDVIGVENHVSEQLGFFQADARVVLDDPSGSIVYYPAALTAEQSSRAFEQLRNTIPWSSERRMMYEREVDVPRLVASARIDEGLLPALAEMLPIVEGLSGAHFTSIGLNLYRDGRDSVAPHNDRLPELVAGQPIALVSLGATRRMTIRSKALPRRVLDLDLEPGSLLVMSYETQYAYDHGIPKTSAEIGPRISLAFRVRRKSS